MGNFYLSCYSESGQYAVLDPAYTGNIVTPVTIDGRDLSVDGAKLDTIETNAKDDQVASEVPFTPDGDITSTNLQAALVEVRDDAEVKILSGLKEVTNVSTTYTALSTDNIINCTTGTFTVSLPTAAGNSGFCYTIKNSGTGSITVDPNGSETIDGDTTLVIRQRYAAVTLVSDGSNWIII